MSPGGTQTAEEIGAARAPDARARVHALAPSVAKLHVPPPRPGIVTRARLVDRVRSGEPVVVISAPAGYGKTTLLSQWAEADERPFAWLTVTEHDNDLTTLVAYLVRALDTADPLCPEVLETFAAAGADGPTVLLPRLGRALLERPQPFVLALDDVHLLTEAECLSALDVLVAHLPEGSQLALATRQDLPLARARLRARGTLMEIRAEDLTLTAAEGAVALRDAGLELDEAAADSLVERTEGWAAGIYLAALAVRDLPDAEDAAARFTGDNRVVAEYLRDELIDGLPDDLVEFLVRTSVLEYLDGPACDMLLEQSGSWAVLEELARSNLFVVPLDATGEQYRYHHLFADLLRVELHRREPDLERVLHARASELFASRGLPNLAIRHARLAGDVELAVRLVWLSAPAYLSTRRSATVERWLALFNRDEVIAHPPLAVAAAWCCISTRETRPINDWIALARLGDLEAPMPDGTPLGSAVSLLEAVAAEQGLKHMADAAARAHELDRGTSMFWPTAKYIEGSALLLLERPDEAKSRLEEAADCARVAPGTASGALAQLALLAAGTGSWAVADGLMDRAMRLVDEHHLSQQAPQALPFAVDALVRAHRGDHAGARRIAQHSRRLVSVVNHLGVWMVIESFVVLARVEIMLGDVEAARVLAREANDLLDRLPDAGILPERIAELLSTIDSGAEAASVLSTAPLTTAELRVLAYLPTHLSFQAIAEDLYVSRNTVKTQAISIYRKLGVSSRGDAVERARDLGLVEA
ncbi:MAG: AAA family ATPase [Acidimicrobiia bacterium]